MDPDVEMASRPTHAARPRYYASWKQRAMAAERRVVELEAAVDESRWAFQSIIHHLRKGLEEAAEIPKKS